MTAIEIARRLCALLQFGGDYKTAYDTFLALYAAGPGAHCYKNSKK